MWNGQVLNSGLEPNVAVIDTLWDTMIIIKFYFRCVISAALVITMFNIQMSRLLFRAGAIMSALSSGRCLPSL